jgi:hypothetical protein
MKRVTFLTTVAAIVWLSATPSEVSAQGGWCFECEEWYGMGICAEVESPDWGNTWCTIVWEGNTPMCELIGGLCDILDTENEDLFSALSADGTLLVAENASVSSRSSYLPMSYGTATSRLRVQELNCKGLVIGRRYGADVRDALLRNAAVLTI